MGGLVFGSELVARASSNAGRPASREVRDEEVERKSWKRNGNGLSGLRRGNVTE